MNALDHRVWFYLFLALLAVGVSERFLAWKERAEARRELDGAQHHCERILEEVVKTGSDCRGSLRQCTSDLFTSQIDAQECRGDFVMLEASRADAGKSKK